MSSIIAKYLKELRKLTASGGTYAYRGQRNAEWGVESAAYRRLKNSDGNPPTDRRFISYHKEQILEPARMDGYGVKNGQELSDLELLAELQHYDAATCLIDFTRNFLVALWFACQIYKDENKKEEGKVFILNINDPKTFLSLEQKDMKHEGGIEAILNFQTREEEIDDQQDEQEYLQTNLLTQMEKESEKITIGNQPPSYSKQPPSYWHWSPHYMNQRILKQDSLFVFGKPYIDATHLEEISIKSRDKESILEELKVLGITRESLFKDMPGFAAGHSHDRSIPPTGGTGGVSEDYCQAGNEAYQRNDMRKAIELYSKAIAEKPDHVDAYYNRASAKSALGSHTEAIEDYNMVIKYKAGDPNAYNSRGVEKSCLNDHSGAIEDYDKAIQLDTNCAQAYQNRGVEKFILENYSGAIEDYNMAIRIEPDYANAYHNRGIAESHLGQYQNAIKSYNKALEINPSYAIAYYNRGHEKLILGEYRDAIKDYDKAIEIRPGYAEAYHNRGSAKSAMNNHQGAKADYNMTIALRPSHAEAHCSRGNAKFALGDYQGAIADYDKAIGFKPNYANAYYNRGNTKFALNNYQDAIDDYNKAIDIMPNHASAYYSLGNVYLALHDYNKARQSFQQAKELAEKSNDKALVEMATRGLSNLDMPNDEE